LDLIKSPESKSGSTVTARTPHPLSDKIPVIAYLVGGEWWRQRSRFIQAEVIKKHMKSEK